MAATSTGNQHGGIAKTQVKCVAGGLPFLPGKGFLFSPPCVPVICAVYKSRGILGCNFFVWHLLGLNCQLLMGKINLSKCIAGIRLEGHPRWDARFTVVNCDWCISFCFGTAPRPKVPRDTYGGAPEAQEAWGTFEPAVPNVMPSLGWFWPLDQDYNLKRFATALVWSYSNATSLDTSLRVSKGA